MANLSFLLNKNMKIIAKTKNTVAIWTIVHSAKATPGIMDIIPKKNIIKYIHCLKVIFSFSILFSEI